MIIFLRVNSEIDLKIGLLNILTRLGRVLIRNRGIRVQIHGTIYSIRLVNRGTEHSRWVDRIEEKAVWEKREQGRRGSKEGEGRRERSRQRMI